jgi:glucose-6-phosphate isomerase
MGQTFSPNYVAQVMNYLKGKNFAINVISKSGTTTETSISFRLLKELLEKKVGKEKARKAIFATTDKEKGALKTLATQEGYVTYVLPGDIGGRYSVFTAVGTFPLACAGVDVDALIRGAQKARAEFKDAPLKDNKCYQYAVMRDYMYRHNKPIEMYVTYEPQMSQISEWLKQLFGESEGKIGKGIFPAGLDNTTDLYSMGQYVQEGERILFETVLNIEKPYRDIKIKCDEEKLAFLNGKTLNEVNHKAMEGTIIAHTAGKVPNIVIEVDKLDEMNLGELLYFFEKACGISGYLLGVNPFNQPGVEAYKQEMFRLLGKNEK